MNEELTACPFCGDAKSLQLRGETWRYVSCNVCDADGPLKGLPAEAIAAWNRRASPTPEGGGEWEESVALAARIVEEYTMYDFGMSPANELKLARALLSSPRVERERALEEAARIVDDHYWDSTGEVGKAHGESLAKMIRALSLQVEGTKP